MNAMKDKYINDIETMIQNWLKSESENTTTISYEIAEYIREEIKAINYDNVRTPVCHKAKQCAVTPGGLRCPKEKVICPL